MKLKNIILFSVATVALTACDDLFEPAIENNQDISQMYTDPQFARGIMDNANLVLPYEENPANMTDVATDNAVSNDINNNYKKSPGHLDVAEQSHQPVGDPLPCHPVSEPFPGECRPGTLGLLF